MASARITRILYVLYLLIISVVLLAEATLFYVTGFPSLLIQVILTIIFIYIALIIIANLSPILFRPVLVLGSKIIKGMYISTRWGYGLAHAYWVYAKSKKAREVTVVFLFAFITALALLISTQLPMGVYYAFFLFVVGYTAAVGLSPETRTLDKVWLSIGMGLGFLLLTILMLPALHIPTVNVPELLTLIPVISLFAVLLIRLTTT